MDRIGFLPAVATRPPEQISARTASAAQGGAQAAGAEAGRPADPRLSAFAVLWQQKDQALARVQEAAATIRAIDRADELVRGMQGAIMAMVKNYPPFPPGSEERLNYLRSISALRQQIEALTVPPAAQATGRIPTPPRGPNEGAFDPEWEAYAQTLAGYRQGLAGLRNALSEQLRPGPMWPEVGLEPPVEDHARQTLLQTAHALAGTTQTLTQSGAMTQSGLA